MGDTLYSCCAASWQGLLGKACPPPVHPCQQPTSCTNLAERRSTSTHSGAAGSVGAVLRPSAAVAAPVLSLRPRQRLAAAKLLGYQTGTCLLQLRATQC
jgi:hypothetical protein